MNNFCKYVSCMLIYKDNTGVLLNTCKYMLMKPSLHRFVMKQHLVYTIVVKHRVICSLTWGETVEQQAAHFVAFHDLVYDNIMNVFVHCSVILHCGALN